MTSIRAQLARRRLWRCVGGLFPIFLILAPASALAERHAPPGSGAATSAHALPRKAPGNDVVGRGGAPPALGAAPGYGAGPVVLILWGIKALGATAIDEFLDYALAALLGVPGPGTLDHALNFGANLTPYLGELRHLEKTARIFKAVDRVVEALGPLQKLAKGHSKGSSRLMKDIGGKAQELRQALDKLDLGLSKAKFGALVGIVREGQLARKLTDSGREILEMGLRRLRNGYDTKTDIDLVFREGGEVVFAQVKALGAAVATPGSKAWSNLLNQLENTVASAREYARLEGVPVRLRYYVDDMSDSVRRLLEDHGVEVVFSATVLH